MESNLFLRCFRINLIHLVKFKTKVQTLEVLGIRLVLIFRDIFPIN